MLDDRVKHLLARIAESLEVVLERCADVNTVNDFLDSPAGMSLLDGDA